MFSVAARSLFAGRRAHGIVCSVVSSTGKNRKYSSTVHGNDAELLEREKHRNLSGTQHTTSSPIDDAPGWNEYLATTSEANVKADRSTLRPEELQAKTVNHIRARHRIDDRPEATGTMDVRDEVSGPLGSAQVGGVDSLADVDPGNNVDSDGRTVFRHVIHEEQVDIKKGS
ncbi:hypothetical protein F5J12DRAFT_452544 [Pisolithus orientalis]|uniref:uncharacterized protein n=1 Tax=Pisolithus orientalis TaxID=936130 RepID=UPI002224D81B|nr:uncharacterized protein F5J12DRAFT_452544 [Pisolithus orientalis]KAI6025885.1 hypothetical protein F5J12DRAFT_452544 [Pisolithus orientalis]